MKRKLFILIAIVIMAGVMLAEVPVNFDPSYVDVDPAVIKKAYKAQKPNLTFGEADTIAQKIFTYTGNELVLDEQTPSKGHQVYKAVDNSATLRIQNERGYIFYRKTTKLKRECFISVGNTPPLKLRNYGETQYIHSDGSPSGTRPWAHVAKTQPWGRVICGCFRFYAADRSFSARVGFAARCGGTHPLLE